MQSNKKIIVVVNYIDSILLFRLKLLIALKNIGYDVIVCSPSHNELVISKLASHSIVFHEIKLNRTGINPKDDLITLINLYKFFKKEKPNLVLNYTLKPIIYSSIAARLARVPCVASMLTGFGSIFLGTEPKTKILRLIISPLLSLALTCNDKIFALNKDLLKTFIKQKSLNSKKTILINGEGLDIDYYNVVSLPQTTYPIFLIITRLIRDKGLYEFIEAAKKVKEKYQEVRFVIVGYLDTNPTAVTKKEFEDLISDGVVEYWGQMEDVRAAIMQSSVYVLPSYAEGIPRSTLEAMSMGRPVITTDAPGCRETVVNGENGFLVPIKDGEELAHAMEKFISQPELVGDMGKCSRKIIEEKYDVNKVNAVILKALDIVPVDQ